MDALLECFFDEVFADVDFSTILTRQKRQYLVDYLSAIIDEFVRDKICDQQNGCRKVVYAALRYHEKHRRNNKTDCLLDKYHNILYVAAKLCHDWDLKDSPTIACILNNIFLCEKTFERLLIGAIFDSRASYFIAGWKSDYTSRGQNISALVYFLEHAVTATLKYSIGKEEACRFIDVPMECCDKKVPVKVVIQRGTPDLLHILLRYGAVLSEDANESGLLFLLNEIKNSTTVYPFNMLACLKLILRVVSRVRILPDENSYENGSNVKKNEFVSRFPDFVHENLVPPSRCGITPPELKHLCRCKIRQNLWKNYQLPGGIQKLPIPETLKKYLDLLQD